MNTLRDPQLEAPLPIRITDPPRAEPPAFDTIEVAARKLGVDVPALRARCRRAAERCGDSAVAKLGGGIVAFKFGHNWRVRFPATLTSADGAGAAETGGMAS